MASLGTPLSWKLCFLILGPKRTRYRVHELDHAHFITATIVEWLPVFNSAACCDIVMRSLEFCRQNKGLKIYLPRGQTLTRGKRCARPTICQRL